MLLSVSEAAAYSRNCSSPQPFFDTPITGTLSTSRSTSPTSAGKVSILARSPVAPKITSASTRSDMSSSLPGRPLSTSSFRSSGIIHTGDWTTFAGIGRVPPGVPQQPGIDGASRRRAWRRGLRSVGGAHCRARWGGRGGRRLRLELLLADAPAEHVVGPALVEADYGQQDDDDNRHDLERIPAGRGVLHGQVVGRLGGGDHHVRVQAREDRDDARGDRDGGRGEGEAVAALVDQPDGGEDGEDGQQLDRVEEERAAVGDMG